MKFVAIKKNDPKFMKKCGLPLNYPLHISEHDNLDEAMSAHGGEICTVMPASAYNEMMVRLREEHSKKLPKVPRVELTMRMSLLGRFVYFLKELFFK